LICQIASCEVVALNKCGRCLHKKENAKIKMPMKKAIDDAFLLEKMMERPPMINRTPDTIAQTCLPGILLAHFTAGGLPTIKSFAKNCKTPSAIMPVAKMICPGLTSFFILYFVVSQYFQRELLSYFLFNQLLSFNQSAKRCDHVLMEFNEERLRILKA